MIRRADIYVYLKAFLYVPILFVLFSFSERSAFAACASACQPDCNQSVVTCGGSPQCRSNGSCDGKKWDWSCCVSDGGNGDEEPTPTCTGAAPACAAGANEGSFRVYAYGVSHADTVRFPTWSDPGGQDDLIWYFGTNAGGGTWYLDVPLASHPGVNTFIRVHIYMFNDDHTNVWCGSADFYRGVAPTANFTSPNPSVTQVVNVGDTITFTGEAMDVNSNLSSSSMHLRRGSPGAWLGSWSQLGATQSCSGNYCSFSRSWTPTSADSGCWTFAINAYDTACSTEQNRCTGSPEVPVGWASCHPTDDDMQVCINTPPIATRVDGPTTVYAGDINFYNVLARDPDCTRLDTNWSYTNGNLPVTSQIRIRARGTRSADTWPDMDVYLGSAAASGAKTLQCHFDVNTSSWTTYTCNVNYAITSLDVVFPNDDYDGPGLDTNLYVDWIEVDGRRIESNSTDPRVYYDRGGADTAFDGDDSCSGTQMLAGTDSMFWSGSLRFPIPWQAPDTSIPSTLTATVTDPSGVTASTSININVLGRKIEGWIWEVTDSDSDGDIDNNDCNDSNGLSSGSSALIRHSETDGPDPDPTLQTGHTGSWYDPPNSSYSFDFSNVPSGANTLRLSLTSPTGRPNFRYILTCLEDSTAGVIGSGSAAITVAGATTNADLGYRVMSNGWFQTRPVDNGSVGGSVYATDISMSVPREGEVSGGFESFLAVGNGAAFSAGNISVADGDGDSHIAGNVGSTSERSNNTFAEELDTASSMQIWPDIYAAVPPSNAIDVTDVSNCDDFLGDNSLEPDETYVTTSTCLGSALTDLGGSTYRVQGSGVVVIYVTGNDPIVFDNNFRAQSSNERVVFVSTAPFIIDPSVGEVAVTPATRPHIEAMLIANSSVLADSTITFSSAGDTTVPADGLPDDTSVVMEGPLIARGAISFGRDRGLANDLPGVVVKYNPMYLIEITDQEMDQTASPTSPSYTGLSTVNVSWGRNE